MTAEERKTRTDNRAVPKAELIAEPVAKPAPPVDGHKPIPKGDLEIEKFNVTNDTGGGD
jgi:hypothetical protein